MKLLHLILLVSTGILLAACEKQAPEQAAAVSPSPTPAAATPAPVSAPPPSAAAPTPAAAPDVPATASDGPTRYIDHGKDEIEFKLKKSLAGMESLLETVSDPEQVSIMKKDMAELQSQLDAL